MKNYKAYYNFCNAVIAQNGNITIKEASEYIPEAEAIELFIAYSGKTDLFVKNCINMKNKLETMINR